MKPAGKQDTVMQSASITSPVGELTVTEADGAIVRLQWGQAETQGQSPLLAEALRQLEEYFGGTRTAFELPMNPPGNDFQRAVCTAMSAIPFGDTRTYGEIARALGSAAQPVGNACGANPIPVIIPCHRVLGANGLGGFSGQGGVETKVALLRLEGAAGLLI